MSKKFKGFLTIKNCRGVYCTTCGNIARCYGLHPTDYKIWLGVGVRAFCYLCCRDYVIMANEKGEIISVIVDEGWLSNAGARQEEDGEIPF